jgi:hypothetical protein
MRIFIDESGSFQIPNSTDDHSAGVVVGVIVPEVRERALLDAYSQFLATLDTAERKRGEPKGSRITSFNRRKFADLLAAVPGVMLIPITVDLSDLVGRAEQFCSNLSNDLHEFAGTCVHQTMRDEVAELSRQVGNLSVTELIKLVLYAECIQQCVHHAVVYLSEPPYHTCWSTVHIVIDRVAKDPSSREKRVFQTMLLSWLTAWSRKRPLTLINEVHTSDHPFVRNFVTGTGIDMRRLVGDGIRWADSAKEPGIQVADIAAAIVFDAAHDLKNHNKTLPDFLSLMRCCPLAARDGPGLVTLLPEGTDGRMDKWIEIVRALAQAFPRRAGSFKGLRPPPVR